MNLWARNNCSRVNFVGALPTDSPTLTDSIQPWGGDIPEQAARGTGPFLLARTALCHREMLEFRPADAAE